MRIFPLRPALLVLLWLLFMGAAFAQTPPPTAYEMPGPYAVDVQDTRWTDTRRGRELPLRLRLPRTSLAAPVILFSHGLGGSVDAGRDWAQHWASHGFIVIHLQHPGSDESVWKDAARPVAGLRKAASGEQLIARVDDVRFVLDELARRQQAGETWLARADLNRIGMSGHSFGALTTQWLAGQQQRRQGAALREDRLRAFIAFSPSARDQDAQAFARFDRPFFSITGTEDGLVGAGLGVPPEQRLWPYELMPAGHKYLLNLLGADHMILGGVGRRATRQSREFTAPPDPARDARHTTLVQTMSLAFWNAYLRDDPQARAWLASAASHVGAAGAFSVK